MPLPKITTDQGLPVEPYAREYNPAPDTRPAREKSSSRPNGRAPIPPRRTRRTEKSRVDVAPVQNKCGRRKTTDAIGLDIAADVLAALRHTGHVGLTPNRHLTINLEAAGITDPVKAVGKLMKLMRDGARRHHQSLSYIWVRERGDKVGEHVHILVHVPPALSGWWQRRKAGWLKRIGAHRGRGISKTTIIRGAQIKASAAVTCPELFEANLRNVTAYVLKHCSAEVQRLLGIVSEGPCALIGKRVSISENLHRAARSRCERCSLQPVT